MQSGPSVSTTAVNTLFDLPASAAIDTVPIKAPKNRRKLTPSKPTLRLGRWRVLISVAFWLLVWQLVAMAVGHEFLLASPLQVGAALLRLLPTAAFWRTLATSALRIAAGLSLGLFLGIALAALAHLSSWADLLLSPFFRALRAVPVVSFVILVLIWTGPNALTVAAAAIMVAPVAFAAVQAGLAARSLELSEVAQVFGAGFVDRFWAVTWPGVVPYLASAAHTAVGLAWKAGVAAEVIGLPHGSIGERLYDARLTLATADVLAWTVVIVLAAWVFERVVLAIVQRAWPES